MIDKMNEEEQERLGNEVIHKTIIVRNSPTQVFISAVVERYGIKLSTCGEEIFIEGTRNDLAEIKTYLEKCILEASAVMNLMTGIRKPVLGEELHCGACGCPCGNVDESFIEKFAELEESIQRQSYDAQNDFFLGYDGCES